MRMILILSIIFSALRFDLIVAASSEDTTIRCPEITNILGIFNFEGNEKMRSFTNLMWCFLRLGHSTKITGLCYVSGSMYYVSSENRLFMVSDIRNGNVLFISASLVSDYYGIQSINTVNNGDILILSKSDIKMINIFT